MIKQFIPHVVLILFINLAQSKNDDGEPLFGNYGGYSSWPYQILGYGTVLFSISLFLIGFLFPNLYSGLSLLDEKTIMHGYGQGAGADDEDVKQLEDDDNESDDSPKAETALEHNDDVLNEVALQEEDVSA